MTHPTLAAFIRWLFDSEISKNATSRAEIARQIGVGPTLAAAWVSGDAKPSNATFGALLDHVKADASTRVEGWTLLGVPAAHLSADDGQAA